MTDRDPESAVYTTVPMPCRYGPGEAGTVVGLLLRRDGSGWAFQVKPEVGGHPVLVPPGEVTIQPFATPSRRSNNVDSGMMWAAPPETRLQGAADALRKAYALIGDGHAWIRAGVPTRFAPRVTRTTAAMARAQELILQAQDELPDPDEQS